MINLITAIRKSFIGSVKVYTRGSCYQFYLIIKTVYPDIEPWYDGVVGHVYCKDGDKFYDITGLLTDTDIINRLYDLKSESVIFDQAGDWVYGDTI